MSQDATAPTHSWNPGLPIQDGARRLLQGSQYLSTGGQPNGHWYPENPLELCPSMVVPAEAGIRSKVAVPQAKRRGGALQPRPLTIAFMPDARLQRWPHRQLLDAVDDLHIMAVPVLERNCHDIEVEGEFGRLHIHIENIPLEPALSLSSPSSSPSRTS